MSDSFDLDETPGQSADQLATAESGEDAAPVDEVAEDLSGDDVIDTITTLMATGEITVLTDTDGDTVADTLLLDLNADGVADVQVIRDGDVYLVSADQSADGTFDDTETTQMSAAELDELIPGATEMLNIVFTADPNVAADPTEETAEAGTSQTYVVQPGDTLWDIAERVYGDGTQAQRIAEASGITDPDLIYPGQTLTIPIDEPAEQASAAAEPVQVVPQDPSTVEAVAEDLSGDGVYDVITELLATGEVMVLSDTDGDTVADTLLLDLNNDGMADVHVIRDGDVFLVSADHSGDGTFDDTETTQMSAVELDELIPGATALFDTQFTTDPNAPVVTAADPSQADPEQESWQQELIDNPELHPNQFGQIGDAEQWSEHWFKQAANGYCVPAAVAQIVSEYTGEDYTDESAFVALAQEQGMLGTGGEAATGMTLQDAAKLLTLSGVPADVEQGDIASLADAIDNGHGVMVHIDSGEYWYPAGEPAQDDPADHCVVVTEIDTQRGVVYLSDPGHPQGDQLQMPIEQFQQAWADSGNTMIVCDEPAIDQPASAPGGGTPPADLAGTEQTVASTTPSPAALETAVDWLTDHPWILLPVVIPATALITRAATKHRPAPDHGSTLQVH